MVDPAHQLFDAPALLTEEAVILDHGADPLLRCILSDGTTALGYPRQRCLKAFDARVIGLPAAAGVMAHARRAQDFGDIDLRLHPCNLRLQIPAGAGQEVGADRVVHDGEIEPV